MTGKLTLTTLVLCACIVGADPCTAADWPDWRGPNRDGTSPETNLPERWSPGGENLLWRAPYPGRSTPIIMGDRLYAYNGGGEGSGLEERVICLNADTGELIWEYRHNVIHSDAPPWRIAWSAPVGDPETGNIFTFGVAGMLTALSRDGELLWRRSLIEELGTFSTHGGRTVSPVIEGDLVIVSSVSSGWGDQARGGYRYWAFDKRTGDCIWVSAPGSAPFDTTYSTPLGVEINGTRMIISGAADGAVHALKAQTGEPVWSFPMSKRGINTEVAVHGTTVFVSHGEENKDTNEMGLIAALDGTMTGEIRLDQANWAMKGFLGGYSSPVVDGDQVYQLDNGSNLYAFDAVTGERLWVQNLGTIQKASLVMADGKIYVGNENGKFYILRPTREGCEILDEDLLGTEETPELVTASAAISDGRVFVVTDGGMYAFGEKQAESAGTPSPFVSAMGEGPTAWVQVVPTELILKPGEAKAFRARLFDAKGRFLREDQATWSLERLQGSVDASGNYTVAADAVGHAGTVKATVDGVEGLARVRIVPDLPWAQDFEAMNDGPPPPQWVGATGKFQVRELDGNKVLVKLSSNPLLQRGRAMMGPADWHDYTVQVDIRATEQRRQMGDAGVVAQGYSLALFGNHQRLDLFSWQADPSRTVSEPFPWESDTWYRVKLRAENLDDGKVRLQGKVWPVTEEEPDAWTIEHIDPVPIRQGSPGVYADAPFELFLDNLKVDSND